MIRCFVPDTSPLDWLPLANDAPALTKLPLGFAAYLKLLPPLGIDRSVPVVDYSFAARTMEQLNARAAFWNQYGIVGGQPAPDRLYPSRIRLRIEDVKFEPHTGREFGAKLVESIKEVEDSGF